ncbi:MAG: ATPase, T2SS/T4P/T4SS family [Acidimicrobiales bacterium]
MSTSGDQTAVVWGELTPRVVEFEFGRLIASMLERLRGGDLVEAGDLMREPVERLRAEGVDRPSTPAARAVIEAALLQMLGARGRQWTADLERRNASRAPTPEQWESMARMAVVRAFLEERAWGEFSLAVLRKRLGDAVRERRRERSAVLGVAASVREVDQEQRVALQGFEAERVLILDEMRAAGVRPPDQFEWHAIKTTVLDEVFSYRRLLEAYELHPGARNMGVFGSRVPVYELSDGRRIRGNQPVARDAAELERMVETLCGTGGFESKTWNHRHYELELSLPDGSRLTALKYVTDGAPYVTIRRHMCPTIRLDDYANANHRLVVELLKVLMEARLSILVVGGMNSGKTTMLRALGSCFEPLEPVYVAESVSELRYHLYPEVYACEAIPVLARATGLNEAGGVSLEQLIVSAQRSNAARIVVGEIRGPEVQALLKAAQLGHPVLSTVHGHNAADGIQNVARYHEQYTSASYENSLAQLCSSLDAVVTMDSKAGQFVITGIGLVIRMTRGSAGSPEPEIDHIVGSVDSGEVGFVRTSSAQLSAAHDRRIFDAGIQHRVFDRLGSPLRLASPLRGEGGDR